MCDSESSVCHRGRRDWLCGIPYAQACAFGSRPVLMTYDGEFLGVRPLHVPRPLHLVIVDLMAQKDTVEILVSVRQEGGAACAKVVCERL